jgi:hypothetical protein
MTSQAVTARFSRRRLLKTGLASVVLLSAGGVGLAMQQTVLRPLPASGLRVLSPSQYAVLSAVADRIAPSFGPGRPGASALDVAAKADALFARADADAQKGFCMVLDVFESGLTGALLGERIRPFTQLSEDAQDRVLAAFRDSRLGFRRTVFHALNALVGSLYYGDEGTWERIGYPGPPSPSGLRLAYAENLVDLGALRAQHAPKGS